MNDSIDNGDIPIKETNKALSVGVKDQVIAKLNMKLTAAINKLSITNIAKTSLLVEPNPLRIPISCFLKATDVNIKFIVVRTAMIPIPIAMYIA